ncbi:MAG: VOC family protein [Betaproteobacteria bacterium]
MRVLELGHVTLSVVELDRSADFYRDVLGFTEVARGVLKERRIAFFSLGARHHDLALVEVGAAAAGRDADRPGFNHMGLKVGDRLDELRRMRDWLVRHGVTPYRYVDHAVCKSLHVHDPDGNAIELYVDGDPRLWAQTPQAMVCSEPLQLD